MADSAAEIARALRDRKYESESERTRREIAEAKARRPPSLLKSNRFTDYKRNSHLKGESEEGEAQAQARAKAKAKARKGGE